MIDKKELDKIKDRRVDWEKNCYSKLVKQHPERKSKFENLSWNEIKCLYTPEDIAHLDYIRDIGNSLCTLTVHVWICETSFFSCHS